MHIYIIYDDSNDANIHVNGIIDDTLDDYILFTKLVYCCCNMRYICVHLSDAVNWSCVLARLLWYSIHKHNNDLDMWSLYKKIVTNNVNYVCHTQRH